LANKRIHSFIHSIFLVAGEGALSTR